MAGVRDPAFWKRFSTAVHKAEGEKPIESDPELQANDWLYRETMKTRKRRWVCPIFWLCLFILIPALILVLIWMDRQGMFKNLHTSGGSNGAGNPNNGVSTTR